MRKLFLLILTAFAVAASAQVPEQLYKISVYPADGVWNRHTGEKVRFEVRLTRCGVAQGDTVLPYDVSYDMMKPHIKGKVRLRNGVGTIDAGTMKVPGFLRCRVYDRIDGRD